VCIGEDNFQGSCFEASSLAESISRTEEDAVCSALTMLSADAEDKERQSFSKKERKPTAKKYHYPPTPGPNAVRKWNANKTRLDLMSPSAKTRLHSMSPNPKTTSENRSPNADKMSVNGSPNADKMSVNGSPHSNASNAGGRITVAPRKGMPMREITVASVHSVLHLRQYDAAKRLGVSVSVLKKACKTFGIRKWPRHFPEELLSDPVVKHKAEKQMNFAEELYRAIGGLGSKLGRKRESKCDRTRGRGRGRARAEST
jgi:hypothetical protein